MRTKTFDQQLADLLRDHNICSICQKEPRYRGTRCQACFNYKQQMDRLIARQTEVAHKRPFGQPELEELEAVTADIHSLVLSRKVDY